jgi:hypothetical protein
LKNLKTKEDLRDCPVIDLINNYEELDNWRCKVTFNKEYQVIFDAPSGYLLTYDSNAEELSFALPIPKKNALELYKMKIL